MAQVLSPLINGLHKIWGCEPAPENGVSSRKITILPMVPCLDMGIFWLKTPFSGVRENVFLTPKPSFPDSVDFDPCIGWTDSQIWDLIICARDTSTPP